jgi:hypothetical protein
MKKVFVFILLLVPCLSLVSLDLGVGVDVEVWVDSEKEESFEATRTWVELMPALILMVSPRMEVRPFAIFTLSKESDPNNIADWDADDTRIHCGLGTGLYYHFIQREIISVCTGPKVSAELVLEPSGSSNPDWDPFFAFEAQAALPVYLDIRLSKRLFFRTGIEIPGIIVTHANWGLAGVKGAHTTLWINDFNLDTLDDIVGYVGFYLMFGGANAI